MSDIIRLLPDSIANQIAAGEVVQRPASIVKELIENAIDAGASSISIAIKEAGKTLIRVSDNGKGMSNTDARLCFERHATSKISKAEDLFAIHTMGFRGEAMASIAAVAQVELISRSAEASLGTLVRIEASQLKAHEPVAKAQTGTMISVKNMFFNVPARRNFLKSNPQETRHILEEVQRAALARPEIAFTVFQGDLETLFLASAPKLSGRITDLLGISYEKNLIPCKVEIPIIALHGYVGTPAVAKKTRGDQYFFVNRRYIKSPYLHHAVTTAFEGLLPSDMFPFYVLHIQIDPALIDINVHPTKTEIKFEDERGIYSLLQAAVRQALQDYNITPSIDFEQDINHDPVFGSAIPAYVGSTSKGANIKPIGSDFSVSPNQMRQDRNLQHWQSLYGAAKPGAIHNSPSFTEAVSLESTLNRREANPQNLADIEAANQNRHAFQLQSGFLIAPVKTGLMIIDMLSALERINYERIYKLYVPGGRMAAQQLMFPKTIALSPADYALLDSVKPSLADLGIEIETSGQNNILVRSLPAGFDQIDEKEFIDSILEHLKSSAATKAELPVPEIALRTLAARAALQGSKKVVSGPEIESLIAQLFASSMPHLSPKGKNIIVVLDANKIESFFV